jgi:sugar lactone lactonase YvrE
VTAGTVDVALDARAEVGEGPVWDDAREQLVWVDIYRGEVHLLDPVLGRDRTFAVGQPVGVARPTADERLVLAVRDGFALLDPDSERIEPLADVEADLPGNLMNDGACDRSGRFLAGTTSLEESPGAGALYRLNEDFSVEQVLGSVTLSNGIDWSPDGSRMYYIDSVLQRIDMFAYGPNGDLGDRRTLVEIPVEEGMPDGLTVDAEGCIWVGLWGGGAVRRYSPSGDLDRILEIPARLVTSCGFGGRDMRDLYITTSTWEMDAAAIAHEPHAGAVFVAQPGVTGLPPTRYSGIGGGAR